LIFIAIPIVEVWPLTSVVLTSGFFAEKFEAEQK
jgi:hypothetical protein